MHSAEAVIKLSASTSLSPLQRQHHSQSFRRSANDGVSQCGTSAVYKASEVQMTVSAAETSRAPHSREEAEVEEEEEADRVEKSAFGEVGTRRHGEFLSSTRWSSSRQPPP